MVQVLKIPDSPITNNPRLNDWLRWLVKTLQEDFPSLVGFDFYQQNVAANLTSVALNVLGGIGVSVNTSYVMPFDGSVRAISIVSNENRTAGSLTVDVTINGAATGLQAILNSNNVNHHWNTQIPETDTFLAGDKLGIDITTVSWAPTSADVVVTAFVIM